VFKIGEVVALKSGSQSMTVADVPAAGDDGVQRVKVQWFNLKTCELSEALLSVELLATTSKSINSFEMSILNRKQ